MKNISADHILLPDFHVVESRISKDYVQTKHLNFENVKKKQTTSNLIRYSTI
jgi:hypothetical protein